jgi:hypothetical protein
MKTAIPSLLLVLLITLNGCASAAHSRRSACLTREAIVSHDGLVLQDGDRLCTPGTFKPPVEITIVAMTDTTDLRMVYSN